MTTNGLSVLSESALHEGILKDGASHHTGITFITGDNLMASFLCRVVDSHYLLM